MAAYLRISLLSVFIIFALIQQGISLNCYGCTKANKGCNDPVDTEAIKTYITPCAAAAKGCIKVLTPDDDVFARGCGVEEDCDIYNDCNFCSDELCNSSNGILPSFLLIGAIASIIVMYRF